MEKHNNLMVNCASFVIRGCSALKVAMLLLVVTYNLMHWSLWSLHICVLRSSLM